MTEHVPEFWMHKAKHSVEYYRGFSGALLYLRGHEVKQWLDETFGEAPSVEKRAAQLAFQFIAANAEMPTEAVIAAYEASKAAGKVHEVDY